MTDISQTIKDPHSVDPDKQNRLKQLHGWNRQTSENVARQLGIELTEQHWKVIVFLRKYYVEHGPAQSGRELAQALDKEFSQQGGSRYLYELFPDGPVAQGSHIACLPVPAYSEDKSFGSSM